MKIRTGFVSNSSSTCFICGDDIGEDETMCTSCRDNTVVVPDFLRWLSKKYGVPVDDAFIGKVIREYNEARQGGWDT